MGRVAADFGTFGEARNAADGQKMRNPLGGRQMGHSAVSHHSLQPVARDAPRLLLAICPICLSRDLSEFPEVPVSINSGLE